MALGCILVGHSFSVDPMLQSLGCTRCSSRWTRDGWSLRNLNGTWQPAGGRLRGRNLARLARFWCEYGINRNRRLSESEKRDLRRQATSDPSELIARLLG
jgi:hypothetical protein